MYISDTSTELFLTVLGSDVATRFRPSVSFSYPHKSVTPGQVPLHYLLPEFRLPFRVSDPSKETGIGLSEVEQAKE